MFQIEVGLDILQVAGLIMKLESLCNCHVLMQICQRKHTTMAQKRTEKMRAMKRPVSAAW